MVYIYNKLDTQIGEKAGNKVCEEADVFDQFNFRACNTLQHTDVTYVFLDERIMIMCTKTSQNQ